MSGWFQSSSSFTVRRSWHRSSQLMERWAVDDALGLAMVDEKLTHFKLNRNYDEAIKVMQRATTVPKKAGSISFHDEVCSECLFLL